MRIAPMIEGIWRAMQHQSSWFVFVAIKVSPISLTTSYAPNVVTNRRLSVAEYPIPVTRMLQKLAVIELGMFAANTRNE